ncbi:hypothetical protein [Shimazuella alba]|uniref:Uncharacterized protein n=1 Tax=Shimazuella alba TaxID=2690964 RepID=A0A6I4W203_9BACL|nr:hypothetical protein [Shimazuella alba]MXQ54312.1 hypothetical protein [Shimazuella alba]
MSRIRSITNYRGEVSWRRRGSWEELVVTSKQRLPKYHGEGDIQVNGINSSEEYVILPHEVKEVRRDQNNPFRVTIIFRVGN